MEAATWGVLYLWNFKSTYFEEHLQTAASENVFMKIIHKEF